MMNLAACFEIAIKKIGVHLYSKVGKEYSNTSFLLSLIMNKTYISNSSEI